LRHIWQFGQAEYRDAKESLFERDAKIFAEQWACRLPPGADSCESIIDWLRRWAVNEYNGMVDRTIEQRRGKNTSA
jgi:hypothetical protein